MKQSEFDKLVESVEEAIAYTKGKREGFRITVPKTVDVKAIRKGLGLTQEALAQHIGASVGSVRDWEQGRSIPEPSTRVLLIVLQREPEAVKRALEIA